MADEEANRSSAHPALQGNAAERLAGELKRSPPWLDDMSRARMERSLLEAWRARGAAKVSLPVARAAARPTGRWLVAGAVAISAAAGAVFGLVALDSRPEQGTPLPVAQFELLVDGTTVQSGNLAEGQTLEAGKRGHIEVSLGASRLDIARESRVRFERLSPDDVRLSLVGGSLDVAFHPERPGEQRLSVSTRAAQVRVVGTRFSVHVDGRGDTRVEVSEGVVRVVPRSVGPERLLRAGDSVFVPVDGGDDSEQAVRAAMEERLAAVAEAAPVEPAVLEPAPLEGLDMDFSEAEAAGVSAPGTSRTSHESVLDAARRMLRQGKHSAARDRLRALAASPAPVRVRVEALTLIAESYTAQGYIPRAADTYRQAAYIAPGHAAGHNALFALARLLERYTLDRQAAVSAYQRYLRQAPQGALASQARDALCRLEQAAFCVR
jgi:hypothetical protein